jgi:hypothetical protein
MDFRPINIFVTHEIHTQNTQQKKIVPGSRRIKHAGIFISPPAHMHSQTHRIFPQTHYIQELIDKNSS